MILDFTLAQRSFVAGAGSCSDTLSTITPSGPSAERVFISYYCDYYTDNSSRQESKVPITDILLYPMLLYPKFTVVVC